MIDWIHKFERTWGRWPRLDELRQEFKDKTTKQLEKALGNAING